MFLTIQRNRSRCVLEHVANLCIYLSIKANMSHGTSDRTASVELSLRVAGSGTARYARRIMPGTSSQNGLDHREGDEPDHRPAMRKEARRNELTSYGFRRPWATGDAVAAAEGARDTRAGAEERKVLAVGCAKRHRNVEARRRRLLLLVWTRMCLVIIIEYNKIMLFSLRLEIKIELSLEKRERTPIDILSCLSPVVSQQNVSWMVCFRTFETWSSTNEKLVALYFIIFQFLNF
jgi:hypothetical protein